MQGVEAFAHGVGLTLLGGILQVVNQVTSNCYTNLKLGPGTKRMCHYTQSIAMIQIGTAALASSEELTCFLACALFQEMFIPFLETLPQLEAKDNAEVDVDDVTGDRIRVRSTPLITWLASEEMTDERDVVTMEMGLKIFRNYSPDTDVVLTLSLERAVSTQLRRALLGLASRLVEISHRAKVADWPRWMLESPPALFEPLAREVLSLTPVGSAALSCMPLHIRIALTADLARSRDPRDEAPAAHSQTQPSAASLHIDPNVFCSAVLNESTLKIIRMGLMSSEPSLQLESLLFADALVRRGGVCVAQSFVLGRGAQSIIQIQSPFAPSDTGDKGQAPPFPQRVQPIPVLIRAAIDGAIESMVHTSVSNVDDLMILHAKQRMIHAGAELLKQILTGSGRLCNVLGSYLGQMQESMVSLQDETAQATYSTLKMVISLAESLRCVYSDAPHLQQAYIDTVSILGAAFCVVWRLHIIRALNIISKMESSLEHQIRSRGNRKFAGRTATTIERVRNAIAAAQAIRKLSYFHSILPQQTTITLATNKRHRGSQAYIYLLLQFLGLLGERDESAESAAAGTENFTPLLLGSVKALIQENRSLGEANPSVINLQSGRGIWLDLWDELYKHFRIILETRTQHATPAKTTSASKCTREQEKVLMIGEPLFLKPVASIIDSALGRIVNAYHLEVGVQEDSERLSIVSSLFQLSSKNMPEQELVERFHVMTMRCIEDTVEFAFNDSKMTHEQLSEQFIGVKRLLEIRSSVSTIACQWTNYDSEVDDRSTARQTDSQSFSNQYESLLKTIARFGKEHREAPVTQKLLQLTVPIAHALQEQIESLFRLTAVGPLESATWRTFSCFQSVCEVLATTKHGSWARAAATFTTWLLPGVGFLSSPSEIDSNQVNLWEEALTIMVAKKGKRTVQSLLQVEIDIESNINIHSSRKSVTKPVLEGNREADFLNFFQSLITRVVLPETIGICLERLILQHQRTDISGESTLLYDLPLSLFQRIALSFLLCLGLSKFNFAEAVLLEELNKVVTATRTIWSYVVSSGATGTTKKPIISWRVLWISVKLHQLVNQQIQSQISDSEKSHKSPANAVMTLAASEVIFSHRLAQAVAHLMATTPLIFFSSATLNVLSPDHSIEKACFSELWSDWFWSNTHFSRDSVDDSMFTATSLELLKIQATPTDSSEVQEEMMTSNQPHHSYLSEKVIWEQTLSLLANRTALKQFRTPSVPVSDKLSVSKSRIEALQVFIRKTSLRLLLSIADEDAWTKALEQGTCTVSQYDSSFIQACELFKSEEPVPYSIGSALPDQTGDLEDMKATKEAARFVFKHLFANKQNLATVLTSMLTTIWIAANQIRQILEYQSSSPRTDGSSSEANVPENLLSSRSVPFTRIKLECALHIAALTNAMQEGWVDEELTTLVQRSILLSALVSLVAMEVFAWVSLDSPSDLRCQSLMDVMCLKEADVLDDREGDHLNQTFHASPSQRKHKGPYVEFAVAADLNSTPTDHEQYHMKRNKLDSLAAHRSIYQCQSTVALFRMFSDLANILMPACLPVGRKPIATTSTTLRYLAPATSSNPIALSSPSNDDADFARFARASLILFQLKALLCNKTLSLSTQGLTTVLTGILEGLVLGDYPLLATFSSRHSPDLYRLPQAERVTAIMLQLLRTVESIRLETTLPKLSADESKAWPTALAHTLRSYRRQLLGENGEAPTLLSELLLSLVSQNHDSLSLEHHVWTSLRSWLEADTVSTLHRILAGSFAPLRLKEQWSNETWQLIAPLLIVTSLLTSHERVVELVLIGLCDFTRMVCSKYLQLDDSSLSRACSEAVLASALSLIPMFREPDFQFELNMTVVLRALLSISKDYSSSVMFSQIQDIRCRGRMEHLRISLASIAIGCFFDLHLTHEVPNGVQRIIPWAEDGDDDYHANVAAYSLDNLCNSWCGDLTDWLSGMVGRLATYCKGPSTLDVAKALLPVFLEQTPDGMQGQQFVHMPALRSLTSLDRDSLGLNLQLLTQVLSGVFGISHSFTQASKGILTCSFLAIASVRARVPGNPLWVVLTKLMPQFVQLLENWTQSKPSPTVSDSDMPSNQNSRASDAIVEFPTHSSYDFVGMVQKLYFSYNQAAGSPEFPLPPLVSIVGSNQLAALFMWIRAHFTWFAAVYAHKCLHDSVREDAPCLTKAVAETRLLQVTALIALDSVIDHITTTTHPGSTSDTKQVSCPTSKDPTASPTSPILSPIERDSEEHRGADENINSPQVDEEKSSRTKGVRTRLTSKQAKSAHSYKKTRKQKAEATSTGQALPTLEAFQERLSSGHSVLPRGLALVIIQAHYVAVGLHTRVERLIRALEENLEATGQVAINASYCPAAQELVPTDCVCRHDCAFSWYRVKAELDELIVCFTGMLSV